MKILKVIVLFQAFICPLAMAKIDEDLVSFFNEMGASANISTADVYMGQKAGYVTGGGVTIRNRSVNLQPMTVSLPTFNAGCGGIDIYTGGFSFVDSKQLISTLKSIGSESVSYAFLLGLETVSPQIANTMKQLQTWANTINAKNINSCEVATQLVGSVWPAYDAASEHICQSVNTQYGGFRDRIATRHKCSTREERKKSQSEVQKEHPEIKLDYNIAWEAIQKQGALTKDVKVAEFLMTLMGTIVVKGEEIQIFPPKASEMAFLESILDGGKTALYTCGLDEAQKRCLLVKQQEMHIDRNSCWSGKIEGYLLSIQRKILDDEELSLEEQELLTKTHLPLYKFVNVLTAYKKGICPIDLKQISDIVAMDLLVQYLHEALTSIKSSCMHIRNNVPYATQVDEYVKSLETVERCVTYYDSRASRLMDQEVLIMEKMLLLEQQIASELCI
jgi:conjugative transfer pilus assembly protein TraH